MSASTYWQSLAEAADHGDLFLNPDAARACSAACDNYIAKLITHKDKAQELANADGWGDFQMGTQIRTIFREKAAGGANNMVDVLESHIEVVREMQAVFQKFFTATTEVDQQNAVGTQAAGGELPPGGR